MYALMLSPVLLLNESGVVKGKTTHLYVTGPENYLPSVDLNVMSHSVLDRSVS